MGTKVEAPIKGPYDKTLTPPHDAKGILNPSIGPSEEAPPPSRGSFSRSFSRSFSVDRSAISEDTYNQAAFYNMNMFTESRLPEEITHNLSSDIDIDTGTTAGKWNSQRYRTPSAQTGPGRNNERVYMYYEVSFGQHADSAKKSIFTIDGGRNNNPAIIAWLNSTKKRRIVADICLQGTGYNNPNQRLYPWSSDTTPINFETSTAQQVESWLLQKRGLGLNGWRYSDRYNLGNNLIDFVGGQFTVLYPGGWRRFYFPIPDNHTHVGFYVDLEWSSSFRTDAAITRLSFQQTT